MRYVLTDHQPPAPLFSEAEMQRRRDALRTELSRRDLSHVFVYGANRSGSAVPWLTGWPVTREALLIVGPREADDLLLVSFYNHVPQARRLSPVRVEWTGRNAIATALDRLEADGERPSRVGVVGPLPFWHYRALAGRVAEVVDLNPAHTAMRQVKSTEEVAALRKAAALTDAAVMALEQALHEGVTEHELVAEIERSYVAAGGMHHIHYLGVTAMDGPSICVPAQWPTDRRIRRGDVVTCEISVAVAPEYAGQLLRTFTVGAAPTPRYARLHAVAEEAFEAIRERLVPGTHARGLAEAGAVIEAAGLTAVDDLVHGFGGGYLPPVIAGPGRRAGAVPDLVLTAGMTVVVQPNVVTPDLTAGVQTGELLLVTEDGAQRLHDYPPGLRRVG
ncbi:Xaa-Pro peptidase family protein [Actinomadura alba]|uniref:M24 family metallopeptidase n=1 Tax=Actinomadura alba TaxID=406431 RepID=UPI0031D21A12